MYEIPSTFALGLGFIGGFVFAILSFKLIVPYHVRAYLRKMPRKQLIALVGSGLPADPTETPRRPIGRGVDAVFVGKQFSGVINRRLEMQGWLSTLTANADPREPELADFEQGIALGEFLCSDGVTLHFVLTKHKTRPEVFPNKAFVGYRVRGDRRTVEMVIPRPYRATVDHLVAFLKARHLIGTWVTRNHIGVEKVNE